MWLQIVGELRLAGAPKVNHWWQSTLYVTLRGLTTGAVPGGTRTFAVDLDLHDHRLRLDTSDGGRAEIALEPKTVAAFHGEEGAFYADAYPGRDGLRTHPVRPDAAFYTEQIRPVPAALRGGRTADDPDATLLGFLQATHEAAAEHAGWDRAALGYAGAGGAAVRRAPSPITPGAWSHPRTRVAPRSPACRRTPSSSRSARGRRPWCSG